MLLLGVELNDKLLVEFEVDVLTCGKSNNLSLTCFLVNFKPLGSCLCSQALDEALELIRGTACFLDFYNVACLDECGRNVELLAFPLNHRVETFGYIIREKMPQFNVHKDAIAKYGLTLSEIGTLKRGEDVVREDMVIANAQAAYRPYNPRSYAYCSDTAPFPELVQWVKGVSVLYHEATFPSEISEMAAKTFHSTTLQAAQCAKEAGVGRLLVGHYSSRYPSVEFYLDELRSVFPESYLTKDMDVIEISFE